MQVTPEDYERIAAEIHSDSSPVGIDAKKTHILILHLLEKMHEQLTRLEQRVERLESNG